MGPWKLLGGNEKLTDYVEFRFQFDLELSSEMLKMLDMHICEDIELARLVSHGSVRRMLHIARCQEVRGIFAHGGFLKVCHFRTLISLSSV